MKTPDHRNKQYHQMVKRRLKESQGKMCEFYHYHGKEMINKSFHALVKSVDEKKVVLNRHGKEKAYPIRRFCSKWNDCFGLKIR